MMNNRGRWKRFGRATLVFFVFMGFCFPATADFDRSRHWFLSLSDEVRISLQTDLTLTGFYDAFIDGAFGPSTYRALTSFQEWNAESVTGILGDASLRTLSRASESVINELDLQIVQDERGQIELAVPRALLPLTRETSVGTAYTRTDDLVRLNTIRQPHTTQSFEDFYQQLSTENERRNVTYQTFQDGYFVVSGRLDEGYFYSLMFDEKDQSIGFTLNWSSPYMKQGSIVSLFLASTATPWTEANTDAAATPSVPLGPSTALPPTDSGLLTEIGNFLIFKEMPGVIGLRGEIGPSTPLDFRRAIRAVGEPRVLILASDGGYVSSALLLAYEVRELGLATYILPDTGCYSACSFVFFAGIERRADGALGVHQVWGDDADASTAQTVVSDILEAFADFGVRQEVTSVMLRTQPESMYVFNQNELKQWGINTGDPMASVAVEAPAPAAVSIVEQTRGQSERGETRSILVPSLVGIGIVLRENGFSGPTILAIEQALSDGGISTLLAAGSELRVLYGPARDGQNIAYRVTINAPGTNAAKRVSVALSDAGKYTLVDAEESAHGPSNTGDGKSPRRMATEDATAYVQLASQRNEAEARRIAQSLITRFGPFFRGANIEIQRVDLGANGIYYRVRVPAKSLEEANAICFDLKAAGGDCFTM